MCFVGGIPRALRVLAAFEMRWLGFRNLLFGATGAHELEVWDSGTARVSPAMAVTCGPPPRPESVS